MPIKPTKMQQEIFNKLKAYLDEKGYEYDGYTGEKDDSYKFRDEREIVCYIKFISTHPRTNPEESIMVTVKANQRNKDIEAFIDSEDFYGAPSKRVFILPNDENSYNQALKLIDTI